MKSLFQHIVISLTIAIATFVPSYANEEKREYFKDWLAACRLETGYCSAVTYINPNPGNGAVADYWLRVGRHAEVDTWEVSITTIKEQPTLTSYFYFQVGENSYGFRRGLDALAYGAVNDFFLTGDEATNLLSEFLKGNAAIFDFEHGRQPRERVTFSLSGLTASMLWIDEQQKRLGSKRTVGNFPAMLTLAEPKLDLPKSIPEKILAIQNANPNCEPLAELVHGEDWEVNQISNDTLLYMVPCGAGAYNFSYTFFVHELAYDEIRPQLFADYWETTGWTGTDVLVNAYYHPETRSLSSFYKGRGLGDCGTSGLWRWTGYSFKMETFHAKSECNGWEEGEEIGEFPQVFPPTK